MALFMCNTSNIKEMELGRPQTVMFDGADVKPNGTIVTLKDTVEKTKGRDHDHVHGVEFLTSVNEVAGKFIIVAPEINVQEYRTIDGQIGKFVLEPDTTYTAYQLQKLDRIEYTEAYFTAPEGLVVGDYVEIDATGKFAKDADGTGETSPFRVVTIVPTHLPVVMAKGVKSQGISLMPQAGLKIKLEVVR